MKLKAYTTTHIKYNFYSGFSISNYSKHLHAFCSLMQSSPYIIWEHIIDFSNAKHSIPQNLHLQIC